LRDEENYAGFGHRDLEAEKAGNAGYIVQAETYRMILIGRVLAAAVSPILVVSISFIVVTFSFAMAYVLAFAGKRGDVAVPK
jgi:hypothetical protein